MEKWTKPLRGGGRGRSIDALSIIFGRYFLIDLSFDCFPHGSDSFLESISLKEASMGILRDRMVEEMKLRNFSPATQESYLYAVTRLTKHYRRSPDQLDREQIRSYLLHLTVERKLSPNTMMGQIAGLRFFYNQTLGWDETKLFIPPRKQSSPLPEVFSPNEVVRLIAAARGLKQRVLLMTTYSAGLRVSELVNLKITDIDPARMTLRVRQGKGGKDRAHDFLGAEDFSQRGGFPPRWNKQLVFVPP